MDVWKKTETKTKSTIKTKFRSSILLADVFHLFGLAFPYLYAYAALLWIDERLIANSLKIVSLREKEMLTPYFHLHGYTVNCLLPCSFL